MEYSSFINEVIDENGRKLGAVANTGNIVIDSLINFWADKAKNAGIDFQLQSHIPAEIPFKGADICLVLGNALENAVEAAGNVKDEKKIDVTIRFDKDNLILSIRNDFSGYLQRRKNGKLKSTKKDPENHGLGMESIYKIAEKYQGTVLIDASDKEFYLSVLLYCPRGIDTSNGMY